MLDFYAVQLGLTNKEQFTGLEDSTFSVQSALYKYGGIPSDEVSFLNVGANTTSVVLDAYTFEEKAYDISNMLIDVNSAVNASTAGLKFLIKNYTDATIAEFTIPNAFSATANKEILVYVFPWWGLWRIQVVGPVEGNELVAVKELRSSLSANSPIKSVTISTHDLSNIPEGTLINISGGSESVYTTPSGG